MSFKGNGGKSDSGNIGDRIPAVFHYRRRGGSGLRITHPINGDVNYAVTYNSVSSQEWYNVVIQQISIRGKVRVYSQRRNIIQTSLSVLRSLIYFL